MQPQEPRQRRWRTLLQVLAILVFPLGLLVAVTVQGTLQAGSRANTATDAEQTLEVLVDFVGLQSALADEALLSSLLQWQGSLSEPGTAQAIVDASGFDGLEQAREKTSEKLLLLDEADRPFSESDLKRVRQSVEANRSGGNNGRVWAGLQIQMAEVIVDQLKEARRAAIVLGDNDLVDALAVLEAEVDTSLHSGELVGATISFWFADPVDVANLRSAVVQAQSNMDGALDQLEEYSNSPSDIEALEARRFDLLVDDIRVGASSPITQANEVDIERLVSDLGTGFERTRTLDALRLQTVAEVRALVEQRRASTRFSAVANLALAAFAAVASLGVAFWFARSIVVSTERRDELETELVKQASIDPLTGLANRRAAIEWLEQALRDKTDSRGNPAVLFVDLDRFKSVNDSLGHSVGDLLLLAVANRLLKGAREVDLVARLGGDEFIIVLDGCENLSEVERIADRVVADLATPYQIGEHEIHVGASAGVALADGDHNVGSLLHQADVASYAAKAHSSNEKVVAYTGDFRAEIEAAENTEESLIEALDTSVGLEVHYQPILRASGGIAGAEALIRWNHPERGSISPGVFIPVAERSDLVTRLDRWVVAKALSDLRRLHQETGNDALTVSVNISGRHVVERAFAERIKNEIGVAGVPPETLVIEVTETILVHDIKSATQNLRELRDFGCRISIDDFGTGYTSISQLLNFPADELKLDRSLVAGLGDTPDGLAELVVQMAETLNLTTVAEGIETPENAASMRDIGCTYLQGYLFARPMPFDDLAGWVANTSSTSTATVPSAKGLLSAAAISTDT